MNTRVKRLFAFVVVLAISAPVAAFAGIGAEAGNQPVENTSSVPMPMTSLPSVPEAIPGMGTEEATTAAPMYMAQMQPQYNMPQMQPQPNMPQGYGDMSGMMMVPQYMPGAMLSPMMTQPQPYAPYQPEMYPGSQGQYQMPGYQQPVPQGQLYQQPMTGMTYPYPSQPQYASADQLYNQAMQAYRSRDYQTALATFQQVASQYPQSDLADNAHYWSGEVFYAWKNYPAAIQSFQAVLQMYPQGNKAPDAMLKMGYAYAEMRQYQIARTILTDVAGRYASNERIRGLAVKKLNQLGSVY